MEELQYFGKLEYIKFEATSNNSYNVMKRSFPFGFQKIATISVIPGQSYELTAIKYISPRDLQIIQTDARRLAGIEARKLSTTVYWLL